MNQAKTSLFVAAICSCLLRIQSVQGKSNGPGLQERNYRVIIERNPFGLRPLPLLPTKVTPPVQPRDEILLTGITSIGKLRAYFMSKPLPGHTPEYYSLGVGERKDDLEVLAIEPQDKAVRVRNAGIDVTMTFLENGVKPPSGTASTGRGAASHTVAATIPSTVPIGRTRAIPSRSVRIPSMLTPPSYQNGSKVRPFAAEQDVMLMELQRTANPQVQFPPTPLPP
jgi:hypothetical protein